MLKKIIISIIHIIYVGKLYSFARSIMGVNTVQTIKDSSIAKLNSSYIFMAEPGGVEPTIRGLEDPCIIHYTKVRCI